jgi:hypothetical protein
VLRTSLSRFIALIVALAAGLAAPGSALTHGYAHQQEAVAHRDVERSRAVSDTEHHYQSVRGETLTANSQLTDADDQDHLHGIVGAALTSKVAHLFAVVAVMHVSAPLARVSLVAPPQPDHSLQLRPEAAHAPPPTLRAPPTWCA